MSSHKTKWSLLCRRVRPYLKSIADTCQEVGIICGFLYAAYQLLSHVIGALFL